MRAAAPAGKACVPKVIGDPETALHRFGTSLAGKPGAPPAPWRGKSPARPHGDPILSRARTAALWGVEAFAVECEVDVGPGLPAFVLVGLPVATAREARERVWPALRNAGFQ